MMNNLFSIFDPATSHWLSLNWCSLFLPLIFMPKNYFKYSSRLNWITKMVMNYIMNDMKNNIKASFLKNMILLMSFFTFISFSNFLSLFPFIFTPTSHLSISLSLSLPFWIALMLKGWTMTASNMLTHLVPLNTPLVLSPFMVLIETTSNLIRPLTLSVRLSANMIAGHLLMSLLSNILNNNIIIFYCTSLVLNLLIILEMSVSIIQSYVFIVLLSLYLNEIN